MAVKQAVMKKLTEMAVPYEDFGCFTEDSVDYPDFAKKVGEAVVGKSSDLGILICDTGIGMSIAANKMNGIRAALCCSAFYAERARLHNNANILCMAAHEGAERAVEVMQTFLKTDFDNGRHQRRIDKISSLER
jgi:ribose 5-phosphate isomerase B